MPIIDDTTETPAIQPPELPFGNNLGSTLDHARETAHVHQRDQYLWQNWGGAWGYGEHAPADSPYILIRPDGSSRAGCDSCEGDVRRRHRELGQRPCPACEAPALTYRGMGRCQCLACGEECDF